jgi:hypothetical protein
MFVIPFKAGYNAGGGYVQRVGAIGTLSDATQRTQQKAIYDMMKTTERLHEPYLDQKPYDIGQVKETPNLADLEQFMKSPVSTMIRKPAIGGSTAMDIQMGEFFRKGGYPEKVLEIARERQSQTMQPEMRNVPLKLSGTPGDIDILLGGKFATTKMAEKWGGKLDTHVHVSKPGTEYWGGYSTKPFTDSYVSFMNEPIKVKTLSVREQFLRYGHSVLPSNIAEKSYRAYKDVPGFYDTFDVLQFQKGGTKLNTAMDRFLNPSGYKSPKVTIGEKFVKVIGGATKINEDWSYGNSKAGYVSSYGVSPIISNPIYRNEGYKDNIKQLTYYESGYKIPTTYTPIRTDYKGYTPPEPTYTPIKTDYNKYVPPVPTYNPPPYNPDYKPPTYIPDYKPTDYTPPYKPPVPYYNPPPYYPGYNPPKNPPKKKKLEEDPLEIMTRLFKGFNVLIKRQHIFGGVKTGYQGYEIKNRVPMTKESAYSTLATMLKNTARASGKIVEVETRNRPIFNKSEFKWVDVADQFYKKQGIIIQKAAHRIGTPGELKEITYKGLAARRRR